MDASGIAILTLLQSLLAKRCIIVFWAKGFANVGQEKAGGSTEGQAAKTNT
jgi:hypothetical protein